MDKKESKPDCPTCGAKREWKCFTCRDTGSVSEVHDELGAVSYASKRCPDCKGFNAPIPQFNGENYKNKLQDENNELIEILNNLEVRKGRLVITRRMIKYIHCPFPQWED